MLDLESLEIDENSQSKTYQRQAEDCLNSVLSDGEHIEKAAVMFTHSIGDSLPPAATERNPNWQETISSYRHIVDRSS